VAKWPEEGGMSAIRRLSAIVFVLVVAVMMVSSFGVHGACGDSTVSAAGTNAIENPLTIVKLKGGPQASEVIRGVICNGYNITWHHWVENSGLKALDVDIYEGFASEGKLVYSASVVFADYGAFPSGVVELPDFQPVHGWLYNYVFNPVGHKGAQALYYYEIDAKYAPIPSATRTNYPGAVSFDASASYDPDGWIVSYEWYWSDGIYETGLTSSHYYMLGEFLSVTLVVTDNDGLEGGLIINIGWW
jgi:hypothetical protein